MRISQRCAYHLRPAIQPSLYRFEREPLAPGLSKAGPRSTVSEPAGSVVPRKTGSAACSPSTPTREPILYRGSLTLSLLVVSSAELLITHRRHHARSPARATAAPKPAADNVLTYYGIGFRGPSARR